MRKLLCFLSVLIWGGVFFSYTPAQDTEVRNNPVTCDLEPLDPAEQVPNAQGSYRKSWALIIGLNYNETDFPRSETDRLSLRPLKNAEKDAADVAAMLQKHYGYTPEQMVVLLGKAATYQAILDTIADFCDESKVEEQDSVLVYFAGHGGQLDGDSRERGAIYPLDVKFVNGRPNARYLGLHADVVHRLEKSKARHKLLILDSCHSGEVFSVARPRSETDDRANLFAQPALQAIASCRASQVASDGPDGNSPFTGALIQALKQFPARDPSEQKQPVWTNRLFQFMKSEISRLPNGQSPDCRNLTVGDGEFHFFPQGDFTPYRASGSDFRLLQAMVPGEHGDWWFEDSPWFMPSLRQSILDESAQDRSGEGVAINGDTLRDLAEQARNKMRGSKDEKIQLRLAHLDLLLGTNGNSGFRKNVEQIVSELTAAGDKLDATDIHFLAVGQHYLRQPEAIATYQKALEKYSPAGGAADAGKPQAAKPNDALEALCLSDFGHYLLEVAGKPLQAALNFEKARTKFPAGAPPAFRVFVLVREADAWQRSSRWGEANRKLDEALAVAKTFDARHPLTAFTFRRWGWALMEQWRINEARESFAASNSILTELAGRAATLDSSATQPTGTANPFDNSDDFEGLIAYLHNLHGLAMARRFQGDGQGSVSEYRQLVRKISNSLGRLRLNASAGRIGTDVESRLVERLINSQERLADCNLFGDPEFADLKEAMDDLRRASSLCHLSANGAQTRTQLLFKQALALSLPSDCQDLELAQAYCAAATESFTHSKETAGTLLKTLSQLVPHIVRLQSMPQDAPRRVVEFAKPPMNGDHPQNLSGDAEQTGDPRQMELEAFSHTIRQVRAEAGQNIHRDQLELLLFSTRILVEAVPDEDRFNLAMDAELLLTLCRYALPKQAQSSGAGRQETRKYLRPYYDAVMRAKLKMVPRQVKDLLEIHWEATRGEFYLKPEESVPVLAMYMLDGKCHLFFDSPRGVSKYFSLDGEFDLETIKKAATLPESRLPLPREIARELEKLRGKKSDDPAKPFDKVTVECWFIDPVREIGEGLLKPDNHGAAASPGEKGSGRPPQVHFPFIEPKDVEFIGR